MYTVHSDKRKSGISLIGDLPWGTHFCQFYQTKQDLLDILVPYFRAGLENNEFCVWVTSEPLSVEDAKRALKKAVPHFEKYAKKGQMQLVPSTRCHNTKGQGPSGKSIRSEIRAELDSEGQRNSAILTMLDKAVLGGFEGLRLACSAFPAKEGGKVFACGADAIVGHNALAVFAYPRDRFDAISLMEVVKDHRFALVRNAGRWEVIESSEARTVKDALKRSEEKLRSLFSNMSEGFAYHRIVLDEKGKPCDYVFLEVNESFGRLTGFEGKDIIGKKVTEALPGIEKDPADLIGKYGKVAMTGEPIQFESYSGPLNKWFSISAFSPHKGYFAVTFSDITERKCAEQELVRAKEEWERTFDSVPDLIAILDNQHRIVRVNKAMAERLGHDAEECVGMPCYRYVHGLSSPPGCCPHSVTMKDGCQHIAELHEDRLGGDFLVSTTPLFDERGQLIGSVHVARDITERKKAEEQLKMTMTDLERSNKELEQFAYISSHDLQEPLRTISNYVQLIGRRYKNRLDSDADEFIDYIVGGAVHMQTLLNDLLTYSRVGSGQKSFSLTDLNSVLERAVANLKDAIDRNNAEINWTGLPSVHADGTRMAQLFQNLVSNAVKFRGSDLPRVQITAEHKDKEWVVRVSDNGIGIDPKYFDRIFLIFKRLHSRGEYEGSGIGLAICKKIVETHGGRIWVESGPGKGTTFYFTIPEKR
ncbi:MAG: PAS domain S-box protein [Nitrospiraceae bacterium]|nr:MAG: PAS domain S-box protein [Nitrospiraceae bacterium]